MRKISAQNERCFRCGACFFKDMERRTPQQIRAEKAIRRSDGSDPLRKALSDEFGRERAVLLFPHGLPERRNMRPVCAGLEPEGMCSASDSCVAKYVWQRINESINRTVDEIRLDQLVDQSRRQCGEKSDREELL